MTKDNKIMIGTRVHPAVKKAFDDYASNTERDRAKVLREALYNYLNRHEDMELSDTMERVANRSDVYQSTKEEQLFIELENERVSNSKRMFTFLEYVDDNLADIYMANYRYIEREELVSMMKDHLDVYQARAEYYGEETVERLNRRREEPVKYAKNQVSDNVLKRMEKNEHKSIYDGEFEDE